jgi:hypothetical protein
MEATEQLFTDRPDATFMRRKKIICENGQLKPGYNMK